MKKTAVSQDARTENLQRHQSRCSVCWHPLRKEIEDCWVAGNTASGIARAYGVTRHALYRHCCAVRLVSSRPRNVRSKSDVRMPTGSEFLAALRKVDEEKTPNMPLFSELMSEAELQAFARDLSRRLVGT